MKSPPIFEYNTINVDIKTLVSASFGDCIYSVENTTIERNGSSYALTPRPAALLEFLLNHPGKAIQKEKIRDVVWAGRPFSDGTLATTINTVREALGDTEKPKTYIESVSGIGYKFLMEVGYQYDDATTKKQSSLKWSHFLILMILLIIMALVLKINSSGLSGTSYRAVNIRPITSLMGREYEPTASKDGRFIAFTHKDEENRARNVHIKEVGTENYHEVTQDKIKTFNRNSVFSPSGKQIAWIRSNYIDHCDLYVADFDAEKMITKTVRSEFKCPATNPLSFVEWKTEQTLLFGWKQSSIESRGIYEYNLNTKQLSLLLTSTSKNKYGIYYATYHSETEKLAYLQESITKGFRYDVHVYDFKTNSKKHIKSYKELIFTTAWVNGGQLLLSSIDGFEIVSLDGDTNPVNFGASKNVFYPTALGDNRFIYLDKNNSTRNINKIDVKSGEHDHLAFSSAADDKDPVLSKDTNDVAFISSRTGVSQVYLVKNGKITQITHHEKARLGKLAISPNGQFLSYSHDGQMYIINVEEGHIYDEKSNIGELFFSFDNKSIYATVDEGSAYVTYQISLSDFSRKKLNIGTSPRTDENGDIYFIKHNNDEHTNTLYRMTQGGGKVKLVDFVNVPTSVTDYEIMNNHIYYINNNYMLFRKNLTTGVSTQLIKITGSQFSINRDGSLILTTIAGQRESELMQFELIKD